jgi:thioredoxin 2
MKKFFWIGKTEKRGEGDASKRRVEIVTPGARDAKAELRVRPEAKAPEAKTHEAKAAPTKPEVKAPGSKDPNAPSAKATKSPATKATPAGASVFEPKPIVPPAPRAAREEDDTRPTRFSSAPPPPPSSSSTAVVASEVRVVVSCLACAAKNRVPAARLADRSRCARCQGSLTPVTRVIPIESESVLDAMATSSVPVLVWLGAAWSGPSSLLGIELEKLASERAGHLVVVRVDVDHRPNVARRFLVESVPTMVLLRRGREEGREVGVLPATALRKRFGV